MVDLHVDSLIPAPWPWAKRIVWSVLVAVVIVCGVYGWSCMERSLSDAHQTAANQAHESSVIHAAQAATYIAQAEERKPVLASNTKAVARAQAETKAALDEVDRLRSKASDAEGLSKAKDVAIGTLQTEVKAWSVKAEGLEAQLGSMTMAYTAQTMALTDSRHEALQLRASLAAKEGLLKAERWKGRIEGFFVGVATGEADGILR